MSGLFDISGKVAIVTGGTRGIGKMIAAGFVRAGVKTYITSRKQDACEATQCMLSAHGECIAIASDLSSTAGIREYSDWVLDREGHIDILVNNAGATWGEALDTFPEDGWDRVMDINLKAPFFLTQFLLPALRRAAKKNGGARVINVGSIEGSTLPVVRDSFAYPASKAGMHHLTRVLAGTLAREKITVNTIAPGPFRSKMTEFLLGDEEGLAQLTSRIPIGRIGEATDIIGLSVFLASRGADYITGETIHLDGGYVHAR
tara:strand:- start:8925 stop:9704 length:780 start_codon:yes stop_codon:yes gene_type:complete